jgi:hypothetical protein
MVLLSKERDGLFTAHMGHITMITDITVSDIVSNLWCSSHRGHVDIFKSFFISITSHSHCGGPGSSPAQVMSDLWWKVRYGADFLRVLRFHLPLIHSTYCSSFIAIYEYYHPGLVQ